MSTSPWPTARRLLPFHRDRLGALDPRGRPALRLARLDEQWRGGGRPGPASRRPGARPLFQRGAAVRSDDRRRRAVPRQPLDRPRLRRGRLSGNRYRALGQGACATSALASARRAKHMANSAVEHDERRPRPWPAIDGLEIRAIPAHGTVRRLFHGRGPAAWSGGFSRPGKATFEGRLSTLWFGERLAAAHFGIRSGAVLHYWFPAYDETFAALSPGLLLLMEMARRSPEGGIATIDLGAGDYRFKSDLANAAWTMATAAVCRPTFQGAARSGLIAAGHALAGLPTWRTSPACRSAPCGAPIVTGRSRRRPLSPGFEPANARLRCSTASSKIQSPWPACRRPDASGRGFGPGLAPSIVARHASADGGHRGAGDAGGDLARLHPAQRGPPCDLRRARLHFRRRGQQLRLDRMPYRLRLGGLRDHVPARSARGARAG